MALAGTLPILLVKQIGAKRKLEQQLVVDAILNGLKRLFQEMR